MGVEAPAASSGVKEEKKKRAKREKTKTEERLIDQEGTASSNSVDPPARKKSKKRKLEEAGQPSEVGQDLTDPGLSIQAALTKDSKKTKSSKKSSEELVAGFPDPSEDTSLSEKAQNALSNALLRIAFPELWKFNKASQNWLLKNFWIPDAIPEKYVPIVVGYLAGCEGGTRVKLLEDCKLHSQTPSEEETKSDDKTLPKGILKKEDQKKEDSSKKKDVSIRASVLLRALS